MKKQFRILSLLIAMIVLLGSLSLSGISFADEDPQSQEETSFEAGTGDDAQPEKDEDEEDSQDGETDEVTNGEDPQEEEARKEKEVEDSQDDETDEAKDEVQQPEEVDLQLQSRGANNPPTGQLKIHKRIQHSPKKINAKLGNEEFTIKLIGPEGNNSTIRTVTINKNNNNGEHGDFNNLPFGTYRIEEVLSNKYDSYRLVHAGNHGEVTTIEINNNNATHNYWLINVLKVQEPETGKIKIVKKVVDEQGVDVLDDDGEFSFLIFRWDEDEDKWEQVSDRKYITGNGEVVLDGLVEGKYKVSEGFPSYQYIYISGNGEYNVTNDNTTTVNFVNKKRDFSNWRGNIEVIKTFEGFGDNVPLAETVEFELWQEGVKLLGPTAIDHNGKVRFENLEAGTYEVKEVDNPGFTPVYTDNPVVTLSPEAQASVWQVRVVNHPKEVPPPEWSKGKVILWKFSWGLEGRFGLRPIESPKGITFILNGDNIEPMEVETDKFGFLVFDNLPEGTYTLTEEVPDGYTSSLPDDGKQITIDKKKHRGVVTVTVNNYLQEESEWKGTIKVIKTMKSNVPTPTPISPAGFEFELWLDGELYKSSDETTQSGIIEFTGLEAGTYVIKEKHKDGFEPEFPDGSSVEYEIEIGPDNENDNIWVVRVVNHIKEKDDEQLGMLVIQKYIYMTYGEELAGFEFEIWQGETKVADAKLTNGEGVVTFEGLPAGTYDIVETNTKGYTPMGPFEVTISEEDADGGTVYHTFENGPGDESSTGRIVVNKKVVNSSGNPITSSANFHFQLYREIDEVWVLQELKSIQGNGTTVFEIELDGLDPDSKFQVREVNIPGGYTLITENNLEASISGEVEFTNRLTTTSGGGGSSSDDDDDDDDDEPDTTETEVEEDNEVKDDTIIIIEEVPEDVPEEAEVKDEVVEEVVEEVPEAKPVATLPKTGATSPYVASGFGTLLLALGIFLRKFRKK